MASLLWRGYLTYQRRVPFDRGKWRLAKALESRWGPASVRIRGLSLELRPYDYIDGMLLAHGAYEQTIEDLIATELAPGDIFVDIGANIGWFTMLAASRGAEVHSFEPAPDTLVRLEHHLNLNCCTNVRLHSVALGAREETLELTIAGDGNPGANSLLAPSGPVRRVPVPVRTLGAELTAEEARRTKLVKIDVEGWELQVLRGAQSLAPHLRDAVFVVEVSPAWLRRAGGSVEELYGLLDSWGLSPIDPPQEGMQYTAVFRHAW